MLRCLSSTSSRRALRSNVVSCTGQRLLRPTIVPPTPSNSRMSPLASRSLGDRMPFSVSTIVRQQMNKGSKPVLEAASKNIEKEAVENAAKKEAKKKADSKDIKQLFGLAKPEAKSISGKLLFIIIYNMSIRE